jgi:hypothetical protein
MFIILALCFVICPLINALSTPLMPVMGCMKDGKFYHEGAQYDVHLLIYLFVPIATCYLVHLNFEVSSKLTIQTEDLEC